MAFTWEETTEKVSITFNNILTTREFIDVYVAPQLVKINYDNIICNVDLLHEVDCWNYFTAEGKNQKFQIVLFKIVHNVWGKLECVKSSKEFLMERRRSTRNQRDLLTEKRNELAVKKRKELKNQQLKDSMELDQNLLNEKARRLKEKREQAQLFVMQVGEKNENSYIDSNVNFDPPRQSGTYRVSLTPRIFHAPARKSFQNNENQFLVENKISLNTESGRFEHVKGEIKCKCSVHDVTRIRKKSDKCYRLKDYSQTIALYSRCLRLLESEVKISVLSIRENFKILISRSTCYFELKCIELSLKDLSKAKDILVDNKKILKHTDDHKRYMYLALSVYKATGLIHKLKLTMMEAREMNLAF